MQKLGDGYLGRLSCNRIVTQMRPALDASVSIRERLLGYGIDQQPARLFANLAFAHALEFRRYSCGLRSERIVKRVRRNWILSQLDIVACGSLPFDIGSARGDRVVIV